MGIFNLLPVEQKEHFQAVTFESWPLPRSDKVFSKEKVVLKFPSSPPPLPSPPQLQPDLPGICGLLRCFWQFWKNPPDGAAVYVLTENSANSAGG